MPLTSAQRRQIEQRLVEERARIERSLDREVDIHSGDTEQDRAGDLSLMPLHQADVGTDMMAQEVDASNAARMSRELTEIDLALERLYRHPERFGVCEDTGADIPLERLRIIPWARTCRPANDDARPGKTR